MDEQWCVKVSGWQEAGTHIFAKDMVLHILSADCRKHDWPYCLYAEQDSKVLKEVEVIRANGWHRVSPGVTLPPSYLYRYMSKQDSYTVLWKRHAPSPFLPSMSTPKSFQK